MVIFGKAVPAKAPTDTVIPFHFFDDTPLWRAFILYSMFVFDDVLDPALLRDSLEALIRLDGWRKLGARLRRSSNGGLEYHVPAEFSSSRPALAYSHIKHDTPASAHPIASRIPKPTSRPATVGDPDEFRDLLLPQGGATKLDHYLNEDRPQLGLHIISFTDKTLVTIHWPHTLTDAMGKRALLNAWMLVLNGQADKVVAPPGYDTDPIGELGKNPTEPHKLIDKHMGMFALARWGLGNIFNFTRSQETRMVCVPNSFITKLRETALGELAAEVPAGGEKPFLSESDVLHAWWTRLAISHLPRGRQRTVMFFIARDLRPSLVGDLLKEEDAPYVGNSTGFINVLLDIRDIYNKPLSYTAHAIRRAVVELGTREQVEAFAALWRTSLGRLPPFFGDAGMHMITLSNWGKAKMFELDLSAAVVTPGAGNARPGIPKYIQNNQFGLIMPDAFPIIGKDADGNFWLSGYLNKGLWDKIEEQLATL
ncbi:hypothetical protein F4779DRAFT_629404 [Xylariaceae sp. FL0662B]|nr:hypothetical protein F4779DRAFT_629404 [Xylariaceae sp. FL0662B]